MECILLLSDLLFPQGVAIASVLAEQWIMHITLFRVWSG